MTYLNLQYDIQDDLGGQSYLIKMFLEIIVEQFDNNTLCIGRAGKPISDECHGLTDLVTAKTSVVYVSLNSYRYKKVI